MLEFKETIKIPHPNSSRVLTEAQSKKITKLTIKPVSSRKRPLLNSSPQKDFQSVKVLTSNLVRKNKLKWVRATAFEVATSV